jgi:peptidoglycan hydrolase CwlO-like protein
MLIRISLVIAILAGLAAGALNFIKVKEKIETLATERNEWHGKFDKTDAELTSTKRDLDKTSKDLKQTQDTLAATSQERDAAVKEAATQIKKATELAEKLTATTEERDNARAELAAYVGTGFKAEQIAALGKQIDKTQKALEAMADEKKILERALARKSAELDRILGKSETIEMPAKLQGKIVVSDPKWEFVVINIGEDEGVLPYGELLVSRAGVLVAKVIVRDVQKGRSIANLMPGWKLADVAEGDQVIPAHPAS